MMIFILLLALKSTKAKPKLMRKNGMVNPIAIPLVRLPLSIIEKIVTTNGSMTEHNTNNLNHGYIWVGGEKVQIDNEKEYYGLLEFYKELS